MKRSVGAPDNLGERGVRPMAAPTDDDAREVALWTHEHGTAAAAVVQKATEDVARLREVETKRRAKFIRLHGARLPRPLLRAVPGLVDPPAPYTPT